MSGAAPAKINVCLFLGPVREQDGRHELVSVLQPVALADTVRVVAHDGSGDACVCAGVEGPNLALQAVAAFRAATGWDGPPQRVEIDKVIPVAGGMAGGSADAAAVLRLLRDRAAPALADDELRRIGFTLGADVPSQVVPVRSLATGAGEHVEPLPPVASYGVLVVRSDEGLSTADVFREADRLGLPRPRLDDVLARVRAALGAGTHLPAGLVVNELEPAALALRPDLEPTLAAVRAEGADAALVSGSGPTVLGLFADRAACAAAADALGPRALATETTP